MSRIAVVAPEGSLGIGRYARDLAAALVEAGLDAATATSLGPSGSHDHAQLGNSTRGLLPPLATHSAPLLVTLHDVVPRDPLARAALSWPQARILSRHRVVVHSRHAAELAARLGLREPADVVRFGATERRLPEDRRDGVRSELSPHGAPLLLVAGVLKRARGSLAVLEAAVAFPDAVFVLAGRAGDDETRAALASAPPNVAHVPNADDTRFSELLASADVLLNFRLDSVGETSAPLVEAHAWGTPMAGWAVGSIPEYCGEHDLLFPAGTPVAEALRDVLEVLPRLGRIPLGDPVVTPWSEAVAAYADMYSALGWV